MSDPTRIVLVDDDADVRATLSDYLGQQGFAVAALDGGAALRRHVDACPGFELAILDITMPGEDGLSLTRFLRDRMVAGIILVTASGEPVDRVVGLELGADDYIVKPVHLRELLARVKAVIRRTSGEAQPAPTQPDNRKLVAFGRCQIDVDAHKLYDEDRLEVDLTSMEFDLLMAFAGHPNRVLSRDRILELAQGRSESVFDRSIDLRIARIRRKVERDPRRPQVIKTVRGVGYMYSPARP